MPSGPPASLCGECIERGRCPGWCRFCFQDGSEAHRQGYRARHSEQVSIGDEVTSRLAY
jgi:hypothetical protein